MKKGVSKTFCVISAIFYLLAIVFYYKGYDKMNNYYMGEYSHTSDVNAYVGGDAYNYIINSNYATGYYVLSMGFLLTGTVLIGSAYIIENNSEPIVVQQQITEKDKEEDVSTQLPEI